MPESDQFSESRLRSIVEECVRRELAAGGKFPADAEDLVESGTLDSMAWVSVLRSIESATGVASFVSLLGDDEPRSIQSLLLALRHASSSLQEAAREGRAGSEAAIAAVGAVSGWGFALGSRSVHSADVEKEFALAPGTIRERAGIDSVRRGTKGEDELTLAARAAEAALRKAELDAAELDWILAAGETFQGFPSLGSQLHSLLLARETCGVLDVGGACVGLLNCLAIAKSLMCDGQADRLLVVTADVHSRRLAPGCVPGEFGGLFGDGASAFVLSSVPATHSSSSYQLGGFQFGCAGTHASALVIGVGTKGELALEFEGEALARAAVDRLERIIADLELRTGISRRTVSFFATHQPNPRLLAVLARQAGVPLEKFPAVAKTCGNLGSSTCGVALAKALEELAARPEIERGPIFLAAVGPGMIWGGGHLVLTKMRVSPER